MVPSTSTSSAEVWSRLVEAMPDAVLVTEAEPIEEPGPRIVYVNQAFQDMTGWSFDEVLGRTPRILQSPETSRGALAKLKDALRRWEPCEVELLNVRKDGSEFWVQLSITPVSVDGGPLFTHWLSVQREISSRKAAELELLRRTEELAEAKKQAERANQAKSVFLANVSHEIRTPLNGVIGMAELLAETDLDPEQRSYLDTVKTSGEALLGVISDVLDYAKIEAGRLELESIPFSVRRRLEASLSVIAAKAAEKGVELVGIVGEEVPEMIFGDPARFQQVLINLLGNAVKFTHRGFIEARVGLEAGQLSVSVQDSGVGIARDRRELLFEMFQQADASTTRRYGGTGLGLAIVRRIAETWGGEVSVESEPGTGSTFRLSMPCRAAPGGSPSAIALEVHVLGGSPRMKEMMESKLRHLGMACIPDAAAADLVFVLDGAQPPVGSRCIHVRRAGAPARADVETSLIHPVTEAELRKTLRGLLGEASPSVVADAPAQRPGLRILVAEDNAVNAKVISLKLKRLGHSMRHAVDGREALAQLRLGGLDLALMDLQMPAMSGLDVTRAFRAEGGELPIVALTANADTAEKEVCLAAGMQDYLTKPVPHDRLVEVLESFGTVASGESEPSKA